MEKKSEKKYRVMMGASILLYVGFFFTLAFLRYRSFFSYEWEDQAEINRSLWNFSQGLVSNFVHVYMPGGTYYKVHMVFLEFILAFFYSVYPHVETIFFLTTSSLALAAAPVFLIARKLLKNNFMAFVMATAYLFYAPKHSLNFLDGDTIIYLVPILLFAFYAAMTGRTKWLYFFVALALLAKTDSPVFVLIFAVYLFIRQGKGMLVSKKTCFTIASLGAAFLALYLYLYFRFSTSTLFSGLYSASFFGSLSYILENPLNLFSGTHLRTLFQLFWPVLLLPLFSLELYIGLPSIALILLTQNFVFQRAHYIAGLVPFIFIGTIYVINRFSNRPRLQALLIAMVFTGCVLSNFGHNIIGAPYPPECGVIKDTRFISAMNIFDKRFYVQDEGDAIAWRMVGMIPADVSVAASGDLLVPISSRRTALEFLNSTFDYYDVDYIFLHNKCMYLGAGSYVWNDDRMEKELKALLSNKEWRLVSQEGDFFLFKKNIKDRQDVASK